MNREIPPNAIIMEVHADLELLYSNYALAFPIHSKYTLSTQAFFTIQFDVDNNYRLFYCKFLRLLIHHPFQSVPVQSRYFLVAKKILFLNQLIYAIPLGTICDHSQKLFVVINQKRISSHWIYVSI
jgi:hypothetical protein